MTQITFIDLFGVPGGMSLGFKLAGMKPVGALDIFDSGIETYRKNFSETPEENIVCADASKNNIIKKFQKQTSLKPGDVDVIIGGPPCQGFSTMGRIKMDSEPRRIVTDKCDWCPFLKICDPYNNGGFKN